MALSPEERNRVEKLINLVTEKERISRDEAVTLLHKSVCKGSCDGYKRGSRKARFDRLSVTSAQKAIITESANQVVEDLTMDEAAAQIHKYMRKMRGQ